MADVTLRALPPCTRIALRCVPALLPALGAAFGVAIPTLPLTACDAGARAALWLGPDEWLLLAEADDASAIAAVLDAACDGAAASIVDISDRHAALAVEGGAAAQLLNEGCPLDLDLTAFPAGACTRTLFGKTEIVLWRRTGQLFHVECARSFFAPLRALLAEAAADLEE